MDLAENRFCWMLELWMRVAVHSGEMRRSVVSKERRKS